MSPRAPGHPLAPRLAFALAAALIMWPVAVHAEPLRRLHALPSFELEPVAPPDTTPAPTPAYPFVTGEDTALSVSIGDTSDGRLVNAAAIAPSEALDILPPHRERDLRYGTQELVAMLDRAARALHAATGTKLWVGNIGAEHGGDIRYSVSHNSGRDADIAFCYQNMAGAPIDPPDLLALNGQGLSRSLPVRFDAKRTWLVVKALLTDTTAQVQYLFIAASLKDQLLLAARDAGEDAMLIQRAATVLRQPGASGPHNDHLHLRIYCGERDVIGGCVSSGPVHPWVSLFDREKEAAMGRMLRILQDPDADQRRRAIERLALLDARHAASAIAARLDDEAADVRRAAARALATVGEAKHGAMLIDHFASEPDEAVRIATLHAIGDLGGAESGAFLRTAVGHPRRSPAAIWPALDAAARVRGPALLSLLPDTVALSRDLLSGDGWLGAWLGGEPSEVRAVQRAAVAAAARAERLEPVPALIDLLDDRDPEVRQLAAHALRMSTNLGYGVTWNGDDETELDKGRQRWRAAYDRSRKAPRDAWLLTGFGAAGYRVPELSQAHAWELVRAVAGSDHLSYNAQRVLMRLFAHRSASLSWSKGDACIHWLRWLEARRTSYKLDKPAPKIAAACYTPSR